MSIAIHIMTRHLLRLLFSASMLSVHHAVAYGHIDRSNALQWY